MFDAIDATAALYVVEYGNQVDREAITPQLAVAIGLAALNFASDNLHRDSTNTAAREQGSTCGDLLGSSEGARASQKELAGLALIRWIVAPIAGT